MYYDTIIKNVSSRIVGSIQPPVPVTNRELFFYSKKDLQKREMDGSNGTHKDTEDTTMLVQMEEVMRAIRALPFVTKLSPVGTRNSHSHGYQVSLRYSSCEE